MSLLHLLVPLLLTLAIEVRRRRLSKGTATFDALECVTDFVWATLATWVVMVLYSM